MARVPQLVADFLRGRRIAVAGVSRGSGSAANPVYRKLRDAGYEVFPVNPRAAQVEGVVCYPDLASIPGDLDGVVVATHPTVSLTVVRQAGERKVPRVWLHRAEAMSYREVTTTKRRNLAPTRGFHVNTLRRAPRPHALPVAVDAERATVDRRPHPVVAVTGAISLMSPPAH